MEQAFRVDLHMHSVFSDGDYTPAQLIARAKALGLDAVALTDHDTDAGVDEFLAAAAGAGIEAIGGVELSTYDGEEIHILGYRLPKASEDSGFARELDNFRSMRRLRVEKMIRRLSGAGIKIGLDDVYALGTQTPTRLHLARILVGKGYARTLTDAYAEFLNPDCPAFVPYRDMPPENAVRVICGSGGIAVLAHPGRLRGVNRPPEKLIADLKAAGLSGIEAHYPTHTSLDTETFVRAAKEYGLFCTNGSDFHRADGIHSHGFAFDDCVLSAEAKKGLDL